MNSGFPLIFPHQFQILSENLIIEKGVRIALSSEENINQIPEGRSFEKNRIRSSYEDNKVRYDITKDTFSNGKFDYQVEIEFIEKPSLETLEEMVEVATNLRKILWEICNLVQTRGHL